MIIAIGMLSGLFFILGALVAVDGFKAKHRRAELEVKIAQERAQLASEQRVKELEAEIFGIGIEIRELPGCTWKLTRGCQYYAGRSDVPLHDANGLNVLLLDADSNTLQEDNVLSKRYVAPDLSSYKMRGYYTSRTVEEIEAALQKTMKSLVKNEMEKRKFETGFKEILSKYNGKAVEVE